MKSALASLLFFANLSPSAHAADQQISRWFATDSASGHFTSITGGWSVHEDAGRIPHHCAVYISGGQRHDMPKVSGNISVQVYENYKESADGIGSSFDYTTVINSDQFDFSAIPAFSHAALTDGNFELLKEFKHTPDDYVSSLSYKAEPGGAMGILTLEKDDGSLLPNPVTGKNILREFDRYIAEIEVSPDLKTVGKVHFIHERKVPGLLSKLASSPSEVKEWGSVKVLSDVTCEGFKLDPRHSLAE